MNYKPRDFTYYLFIAARLVTIRIVTQTTVFIYYHSQLLWARNSDWVCLLENVPSDKASAPKMKSLGLESVRTHSLGLAVNAGCQLGAVSQTEHAHEAWTSSEHGGWIPRAREGQAEVILPL